MDITELELKADWMGTMLVSDLRGLERCAGCTRVLEFHAK